MKSLVSKINESVEINEADEMEFDDVLLELQIIGFKVKESKPNKVYVAKKGGEHDIRIERMKNNRMLVSSSRDSNKEVTEYTYTEFIDDMVVNSL